MAMTGMRKPRRRPRRRPRVVLGGEGLALYKRVKLEVTRTLSSGAFSTGQLLPTEKQLAARYGVSIGTIRRAIDDLVAEHVLIRQQGRGTYLATFSPERLLNRFWPVFRKDGTREIPIVQTLLFQHERASAEAAEALAIGVGDPVYRIVNLLLMGGNPVLLDDVVLPTRLYPGLTEETFVSRDMTMYGLYQSRYGINVIRTVDRLHGVAADEPTAERLGLPVGTPLLAFTRIAYTFDDKPVELRRTQLYTDAYEYRNSVGGSHRGE
jgi:GntR family transcriptional regulator